MDTKSPCAIVAGSVLLAGTLVMGSVSASYGATISLFLDRTIEVFRVGDFDPSDTVRHPRTFTVVMNGDPGTRSYRLYMRIDSSTYGLLAEGLTGTFELVGEDPPTHISNLDLTRTGSGFEFDEYEVQPDSEELDNLVLDLGYLPEGEYCFYLELRDALGDSVITDSGWQNPMNCLTVTNPQNLELIRPGAPFGDELPHVLTRNPQFQFNSRARAWRFEVAKAEPGDVSGEDVMEHVPVYRATLCSDPASPTCPPGGQMILGGGEMGTVSWMYPSAAEELRRGRTYCWRITALVQTSGGEEEISSEVFCFQRWDPSDIGAEEVADALSGVMQRLTDELGPELDRMIPTGAVLLDGTAIDTSELMRILSEIESGDLVVTERRLE